jgi:hypothetical protein
MKGFYISLILFCVGCVNQQTKQIHETKKDIDKVMEMSKKNNFERKPLKKGGYKWKDRK